ncbi:MAG: hypothetical protein Q8P26_02160 [Candidatus Levybacteria bacterium]|nr:hypothetical protein [Candidatus Levybacteria bacterium]
MKNVRILLSSGSLPWINIKKIINLAKTAGYDGIELVPTRKAVKEIKEYADYKISKPDNNKLYLSAIKSIHQNWRLDIGQDKSYGIKLSNAVFFNILRLILFPKIIESNKKISLLSKKLNISLVVHGISEKWTMDNRNKEFSGGILYEMIGDFISPSELKVWMENEKHNIVTDSRDDQSLVWAKKHGFDNWQAFWNWLGLEKIKNYQLTLIGIHGLRKIIRHEKSLAEKQLLWLHKKNWHGDVTIEVNPLIILILFKGNIKNGLLLIGKFVKQTLIEGKKWSA